MTNQALDAGAFAPVTAHLDSFVQVEQALQRALAALAGPGERLADLGENALPLGAFGEAEALSERLRRTADQMHDLTGAMRRAVAFSEAVTRAIATGYEMSDQHFAGAVQAAVGTVPVADGIRVPPGSAIPPGYPGTGGTVYHAASPPYA